MTFKTIIKDELRGNIPTYKEYFLATIFSAALIFMTLMIIYHPELQLSALSKNFVEASKAVTFIIGIFLFFFIYYSEYTFLKHRSRDYAMFSILGMKRRQLLLMNFCESFTVFFSAFIAGILIAILFAKLIFMAFAKLLDLNQMEIYLPTRAFAVTAIAFALVFTIIQVVSMIILCRTRVKDFLQFGKVAQKVKKVNVPVAIVGILLMGTGYYLSVSSTQDNLLDRVIPVTLMVVAGMYCFYREVCPWILQLLSKRKRFYFKGVNMLWVSDLKYRIKDFTMILYLITVSMSVGLTGFSAVFNVASSELEFDVINNSRYPIAVVHVVGDNDSEGADAAAEGSLWAAGIVPDDGHREATTSVDENQATELVVGVRHILDSLKVDYSEIHLTMYSFENTSHLLIEQSDLPLFYTDEQIAAMDFSSADTVATGTRGRDLGIALPFLNVYAVADGKMSEYNKGYSEQQYTLFQYEKKVRIGKQLMALEEQLFDANSQDGIYSGELFKYFYFIARRSYLFLSFYFVIVFYVCAACMLYFKFFNNATEESLKYANYSKVGLSNRELRRSSTIQMASLFFLPGLLTVVNTVFAMTALTTTSGLSSFVENTLIIILFTLFIQLLYFIILRRSYLSKIA